MLLRAATRSDRLSLHATINFESLTLAHGELTPGAWGEGFVDRRHPHTTVHELMLVSRLGALTLATGKGFVPFGTDDPMSRPLLRYPVNHHFSQVLERAVTIAGVSAGPVELEGALFNGDEPERPGQWPRIAGRFGDSWAVRLTVRPGGVRGLEVQGSRAKVHSPEHRPGAGSDQFKWNASLRWDRNGRYGLVEWARTSELDGFFVFHSLLVEGAWTTRKHGYQVYSRFERTERPEEQRTLDLFRSVRPHLENSILGISRWTIYSLGASAPVRSLPVGPFVELSYGRIAKVGGGVFDPVSLYGGNSFWSASLGVRVVQGMRGHRMGRYGVGTESRRPEEPHSHQ